MGMKQDWFTVERLDGDTFAISEYGHREEMHSYLLLGAARALLIDAGLGIGRIGAVVSELTALPVTAAVTHVHWDHIGGLGDFERIAVHENELQWLKAFPLPRERVRELVSQGLRRSALPEGFDLCAYTPFQERHSVRCATETSLIWAAAPSKSFIRRGIPRDIAVFTSGTGDFYSPAI